MTTFASKTQWINNSYHSTMEEGLVYTGVDFFQN